MTSFDAMLMSGADYGELSRSFSAFCRALPRETAKRLCSIRDSYFARFGFDGVYQRMNGRTVSQVFAEYQPADAKAVASGEIDGVRYRLYEAPAARPEDGGPAPGE